MAARFTAHSLLQYPHAAVPRPAGASQGGQIRPSPLRCIKSPGFPVNSQPGLGGIITHNSLRFIRLLGIAFPVLENLR
jgi:hypothetical protein